MTASIDPVSQHKFVCAVWLSAMAAGLLLVSQPAGAADQGPSNLVLENEHLRLGKSC